MAMYKKVVQSLFVFVILLVLPSILFANSKDKKPAKRPVLGWVEKVTLFPGELTLHAKLDTGHAGAAIYARNITRFKKKQESWAKFTIQDRYGKEVTIERKIIRRRSLKVASGATRSEYVVELGLCLGGRYFQDELSLSDRESF